MTAVEISHSRMRTFQNCPWLYHLVYGLGWRHGPNGAMALGQSLHKTLEAYLSPVNTEQSLERLLELYDQHWVNEGFASPQQTMDCYERGRKMLEHFFQIDRHRVSTVEATEKEFNLEIVPDVRFRGTLDRLDRTPDGKLEVIEYKTGSEPWSQQRCDTDMQMTLYALGLQLQEGTTPNLKYYFLATGTSVETSRTSEQLEAAKNALISVASAIRSGVVTPNHAHCERCEFSRRCEKSKLK